MKHSRSIQLIPDEADQDLDPGLAQMEMRVSLDDLREWELLGGKCTACSHEAWLDQSPMRRRFGGRPLIELQPLLRCRRCQNRGNNFFIVGRMARD